MTNTEYVILNQFSGVLCGLAALSYNHLARVPKSPYLATSHKWLDSRWCWPYVYVEHMLDTLDEWMEDFYSEGD
jgi:hypothetical protein